MTSTHVTHPVGNILYGWNPREMEAIQICHQRHLGEIVPPIHSSYDRHLLTFYTTKPLREVIPQSIIHRFPEELRSHFLKKTMIRCDVQKLDESSASDAVFSGDIYPVDTGGNFRTDFCISYEITIVRGSASITFGIQS